MPFLKLNFRPGINRDQTSYSGEGGWYECDKVRFFSGYPQKLGGWEKVTPYFFFGTSRQMFNWITSFSDNLLAIGTNNHVYIEVGGQFYNITPVRRSVVPSIIISGTAASGAVGTTTMGADLSGAAASGASGSVGSEREKTTPSVAGSGSAGSVVYTP